MPTTYYARNVTSDLSAGGGRYDYSLLKTSDTLSTLTFAVNKVTTVTADYFTNAGDPGSEGSATGTWTFEMNITTGDAGVRLTPTLYRINSGGSVQASVAATPQNTNAGVLTFTWTNPTLGTFAAGDRIRVGLSFLNGTHTNASLGLGFNDTDSEFIAPYTLAGPKVWSQAIIF